MTVAYIILPALILHFPANLANSTFCSGSLRSMKGCRDSQDPKTWTQTTFSKIQWTYTTLRPNYHNLLQVHAYYSPSIPQLPSPVDIISENCTEAIVTFHLGIGINITHITHRTSKMEPLFRSLLTPNANDQLTKCFYHGILHTLSQKNNQPYNFIRYPIVTLSTICFHYML